MADGQLGPRAATSPNSWPIAKVFTGFRIALDVKKLALAGAGIFVTYLGWLVISLLFYTDAIPQWDEYKNKHGDASWRYFQRDRARWNLLHKLAGSPTKAVRYDAGDYAKSPEQFVEFTAVLNGLDRVKIDDGGTQLVFQGTPIATIKASEADVDVLKKRGEIPLSDITLGADGKTIAIGDKSVVVESGFETLANHRTQVKPLSALLPADRAAFDAAFNNPKVGRIKPGGKFRVCPWNEDRGENAYLLSMKVVHGESLPFGRGGVLGWLLHDQLPVLLEPAIKLFSPIWYLLDGASGGWRNRPYLVCIILWSLAVWGYFGGAICRLAAVQFARNEKIPLSEALGFVNQRCKHFLLAPAFPLICLLVLTLLLAVFGLLTGYTYWLGDVVGSLLWPLDVVVGLVMAVLVVGLFAWPLMYPTIAVEGSDSFDALSRSYSYLYQAPWNFLGYAATSLAYGAAVVFFVALMGSLAVYLGKWGFSEAPGLASQDPSADRTPVYLFQNAPASLGWRDLLLHDSYWAQAVETPAPGFSAPVHYELNPKYEEHVGKVNTFASWIVTFWLGLIFLLVVGFGYSYFWTASTILYFLMRKKVDDTDFDEIYLDEGDIPPPPPPQMKEPAPTPAPSQKPGTLSLNVVDPPPVS